MRYWIYFYDSSVLPEDSPPEAPPGAASVEITDLNNFYIEEAISRTRFWTAGGPMPNV